jgi:cyanate lyase
MSTPTIFGVPQTQLLGDLGTALLQIKNARGLTLNDMAQILGRIDDQVAKYIAGEAEMGVLSYRRALEAWPELASLIAETAADRAAKTAQRPLDIDLPTRRNRAA